MEDSDEEDCDEEDTHAEQEDVFYDTSGAIVGPHSSLQRLPILSPRCIIHVQRMGTQKVKPVRMRAMRSACALIRAQVGLGSCALLAACATTKLSTCMPVQD